jgi:hypothetical protein
MLQEVAEVADALWLTIEDDGTWDIGLNDMSTWANGDDRASLLAALAQLP